MENLISLHLSKGKVFVWNAEDACTLRAECRVVGTLVGSLPRAPRQNIHLGLPLQLMPEEVTLLLRKGFAKLVDDDVCDGSNDSEKVVAFSQMRKEQYEAQINLFRTERRKEISRNRDKIIEGKKAKWQKISEERRAAGMNVDIDFPPEEDFHLEKIDIPPIGKDNSLVQLFTENPWRVEASLANDGWKFPSTDAEWLRFRVFENLWEQQYYLTVGGKFGGDFLVYPGDPARFHSFYIAVCKPFSSPIPALNIVALGRLGSNVKKTVLLCSLDTSNRVVYTSLQWSGIS
ncbi:tRNA-splicing endonuclease subunit Sen34-like [Gigantopelta aegis]|uniref:tRNA-splicing endonuclease subunit Sen34-like n=1 Tax=Gigantopelta aegis TaxID=1735272 RepID=UPI001B888B7A|nr:tRNA-splicing endonuclease subunit Sen34-like [Gigantopelta aegis]